MTTLVRHIRIGVDIGGTFTDLQIADARNGRISAHKLPTTPADPSIGLMDGIRAACERFGFTLEDVGYVLHGTTIATNAVLERKLARGALVTTAGFEDVLEIGRHARRDIYAVHPQPTPALIPRDRRLGLVERMTARGTAEIVPTETDIAAIVERVRALDVETVAIAFLHAYRNGAHEIRLADAIRATLPHLTISLSSKVSPEIREYERTSTTVLNALLQPVVRGYIQRLRARMAEARFAPTLLLVQSNGGVCSPETAADEPVRLLLSGPSGGAMAALGLARDLAMPNLVGVDMGGTSYDVAVVKEGAVEIVTQGEIDRLPVRVPMVEIRTIGAGGGSIAQVDVAGRLSVGPQSAGARPGPVCYGRGGTEPTVTDANLILGRLDPAFFLGGTMPLDLDAARRALTDRIGTPLGRDAEGAAAGILRLTDTALAAAIRVSLFEKGLDPRDFTLLSFGGAGSVHACAVAEELGIRRIVFPVDASTLSARGILQADIEHAFARVDVRPFTREAFAPFEAHAHDLSAIGTKRLDADAIPPSDRAFVFAVDLRYRGQAFELTVPWGDAPVRSAQVAAVAERFHALHQQRFSYADRAAPVEIVALRLTAIGHLPKQTPAKLTASGGAAVAVGHRRVFNGNEGFVDAEVHRRDRLNEATQITGPAIIEEDYTTVWLAASWSLVRSAGGHLIATRIEGVAP
jgi:N-methylhydantoinase A/oxoprolinase/acetone carboxylase beta subunit